jgi:hypothetical protein
LLTFENGPSAPVFEDLHWQLEGASQNRGSIKGTKKLLRIRYINPRVLLEKVDAQVQTADCQDQ